MKNNLKPYREKHGVSNKEAMKAVCLSSSPFIAPSQRYALNSALAHAISSPRRSPHSGATRLKTRVAAKSPRRGRRRPRRKRPRHRSKARRPRRARRSPRATLDGLVFTVVTQRQSGHSNPFLLSRVVRGRKGMRAHIPTRRCRLGFIVPSERSASLLTISPLFSVRRLSPPVFLGAVLYRLMCIMLKFIPIFFP